MRFLRALRRQWVARSAEGPRSGQVEETSTPRSADADLAVLPRFRLARSNNRLVLDLANLNPTLPAVDIQVEVKSVVRLGRLTKPQSGRVRLGCLRPLASKEVEVPTYFCDFDSFLANLDEASFVRTVQDVDPIAATEKLRARGYLQKGQPSVGVLSLRAEWRIDGVGGTCRRDLEAPLYIWLYDHGVFYSLLQGGEGPEVHGSQADVPAAPRAHSPERFSADVALSFVEADRATADRLREELEARRIRVLVPDAVSQEDPSIDVDAPHLIALVSVAYADWMQSHPGALERLRDLIRRAPGYVLPLAVSDGDPSVIDSEAVWIDDREFDAAGIANLLLRRLDDARRRGPVWVQLRDGRLDVESFRSSLDRWKSWPRDFLRYTVPVNVALPPAIADALKQLRYRNDVAESEQSRIERAMRLLVAAEAEGTLDRRLIDLALDSFVSCVFASLARVVATLLGSGVPPDLEHLAAGTTLEGGPVLAARGKLDHDRWLGFDLCAKEGNSVPSEVRDELFLPKHLADELDGDEVDEDTYFRLVVPQLLLLPKELSVEYRILYRDRFYVKVSSRSLERT